LTTHFRLVPRLRMSGAIPTFHLHAFRKCAAENFTFFFKFEFQPSNDHCVCCHSLRPRISSTLQMVETPASPPVATSCYNH
jgi:hypothetical protein